VNIFRSDLADTVVGSLLELLQMVNVTPHIVGINFISTEVRTVKVYFASTHMTANTIIKLLSKWSNAKNGYQLDFVKLATIKVETGEIHLTLTFNSVGQSPKLRIAYNCADWFTGDKSAIQAIYSTYCKQCFAFLNQKSTKIRRVNFIGTGDSDVNIYTSIL
jgi:hypothetical protein